MKALVTEVVNTINSWLSIIGLQAREYTGDVNLTADEFANTTLIVSTPEKWDILSWKNSEWPFMD